MPPLSPAQAVAQLTDTQQKLYAILNGPASGEGSTVETESNPAQPTVAKLTGDAFAAVNNSTFFNAPVAAIISALAGDEADGYRGLVAASGTTGDLVGKENQVVQIIGGEPAFSGLPVDGAQIYVISTSRRYRFDTSTGVWKKQKSRLVYLSDFTTLAGANAFACAAGADLVIDEDNVLVEDFTFTATRVRGSGGVITLGDFDLDGTATALSGSPAPIFSITGTGRVGGSWIVKEMIAEWFGASPTALEATNSVAINAALQTGYNVLLAAKGIYQHDDTIRLRANSQLCSGQRMGHVNTPTLGTTLKYTGADGYPATSIHDGTTSYQGSGFANLNIDANAKANYAFEGFHDGYGVGLWWNFLDHVLLRNSTVANIYLGAAAAPGSNDYSFRSIISLSAPRHVKGACGPAFFAGNCMFYGATVVGLDALAGGVFDHQSSEWSHNKQDFQLADGASFTQAGGWFEQSNVRIGSVTTSGFIKISGARLHTGDGTMGSGAELFDLQNAAGQFSVMACNVAPDTSSYAIKNIGTDAYTNFAGSNVSPQDGYTIKVASDLYAGYPSPGSKRITVENTSADAAADAVFRASNGSNSILYGIRGVAETVYGILAAGMGFIYTAGAAGFGIVSEVGPIKMTAGSSSTGVSLSGGSTSWGTVCDEDLKDIIEPISDARTKVRLIRSLIVKYKTDPEDMRRAMLIAQDCQQVQPEAVSIGEDGYLELRITDMIPLIFAFCNEADRALTTVESDISAIKDHLGI